MTPNINPKIINATSTLKIAIVIIEYLLTLFLAKK